MVDIVANIIGFWIRAFEEGTGIVVDSRQISQTLQLGG